MLTLDRRTVTVPAHDTATVTATADPTKARDATWYEGAIRATAHGIEVGTAIGLNIEPQTFDVTGKVIDPDGVSTRPGGTPMIDFGAFTFARNDGRIDRGGAVFGGTNDREPTVRLTSGSYSVAVITTWTDQNGINQGVAIEPEVDVSGDTTVTLDLRKLHKVTVSAPGSEDYVAAAGLVRLGADQVGGVQGSVTGMPAVGRNVWVSATEKVRVGEISMASQHLLGAKQIAMSVRDSSAVPLHPRYQGADTTTLPKLSGRSTLDLVSGGTGTAADLAGLDLRGKLVLLDLSDLCPQTLCNSTTGNRVAAVARAGAAAVLGFGSAGHAIIGGALIPTMSIPADEGAMLLDRLAQCPVSIDTDGTALTPYYYSLAFHENGQIPTDLDYAVTDKDVYRIDNRFHSDIDTTAKMTWSGRNDKALLAFTLSGVQRTARSTLTDYVGPVGRDLLWNRKVEIDYLGPDASGFITDYGATEYFDRAGQRTESWAEQPLVLAPVDYSTRVMRSPWMTSEVCMHCRAGDTMVPTVSKIDQAGHITAADTADMTLTGVDGARYPAKVRSLLVNAGFFLLRFPFNTFDVPAEKGAYRLDAEASSTYERQLYSTRSENSYTFTSQRPDAANSGVTACLGQNLLGVPEPCGPEQVLRLRYGVDLDLDNTTTAGTTQKITVSGYYGFGLNGPKLRSLKLEISVDDGAHWQTISTSPNHNGGYTGDVTYPALDATTGAVSIRAKATDNKGNTVEQTIHRAYGLR